VIIAFDARPLMTREIGGAEQHARNVVAQWAALKPGHEFLAICDRSASKTEGYDPSFVDGLGAGFKRVDISGFSLGSEFFVGTRMLHALSRTLARSKADVYHSFTPMVPKTSLCPVVQTIHDLSYELDPSVRHRPASWELRRFTRLGTQWAKRIIAVSSQTQSDIASVYRIPLEQIAVVYNGINPVFVSRQDEGMRASLRGRYGLGKTYILAVGSDIPRRNYARVLEAMRTVWQAEPQIRLVLAGRTEWKGAPIYKRVQAEGLGERVVFVGGPSDAELAQLYRDAVLTCCASSFEGFGMSVLESMACGTAVTCSDMRSLREVADDAALYFPHDDAATMGESLLGLLEDVEYRRQLKYRGLGRAMLFTWETAARQILKVLETVGAE